MLKKSILFIIAIFVTHCTVVHSMTESIFLNQGELTEEQLQKLDLNQPLHLATSNNVLFLPKTEITSQNDSIVILNQKRTAFLAHYFYNNDTSKKTTKAHLPIILPITNYTFEEESLTEEEKTTTTHQKNVHWGENSEKRFTLFDYAHFARVNQRRKDSFKIKLPSGKYILDTVSFIQHLKNNIQHIAKKQSPSKNNLPLRGILKSTTHTQQNQKAIPTQYINRIPGKKK